MELNKRGVSGVIVAVLMILLVIAAVAIFWTAIRPFITKSTDGVNTTAECLTVDLEVVSATVPIGASTDLTMKVKKNAGDAALTEINVYINGALQGTKISGANVPGLFETKTVAGYTASVGQNVSVVGLLDSKVCGTQSEEATVMNVSA